MFRFPNSAYGAIMHENEIAATVAPKEIPWNKGKLIGPKPPLQQKHVWAIRTRLQIERQVRELALFTLAIDSKLRGAIWSLSGSMFPPERLHNRTDVRASYRDWTPGARRANRQNCCAHDGSDRIDLRPQQEIANRVPLIACWARRAQRYSGSLAPRADLFDWVVRAPLL